METKKINIKLLEFQTNIEVIKKDGKNEFFKKSNGKASSYATLPNVLAEVKPLLNALKIVVTQPIKDGKVFTILTDSESGEFESSEIALPIGLNAQQTGSAVTYFRRYTLCSLLALEIDEDDDGNAASGNTQGSQNTNNDQKTWLNKYTDKNKTKTTETWEKVVAAISSGQFSIGQVEAKYKLSKDLKTELESLTKS